MNTVELVKTRRSVRTFDGRKLTEEDKGRICSFIETIRNPYDIPVEFVLLDAKEYGLSSPVLVGDTLYVAAKVEKNRMPKKRLDSRLKSWCFTHGQSGSEQRGSAEP